MKLIKVSIAFIALVSLQTISAQWLHVPTPVDARMTAVMASGGVPVAGGGGSDACATCPDGAAGADVICEDFEEAGEGYLCSWSETIGSGDSIATASHSGTLACTDKGSKALQVVLSAGNHNTYTEMNSGSQKDSTYASFYINIVSESLADGGYATVVMASGATAVGSRRFNVFLYQDAGVLYYGLEYWQNGNAYTSIIGTTAISTGTWYKVDAYYSYANSLVQFWVNNTSQGSASDTDTDAGYVAQYYYIGTGEAQTDSAVTFQIDNFKVDDDTRPTACPTS